MIGLVQLGLAAIVLAIGADLFADNVGAIASSLHVRSAAVALVLAGAEPEELATAAAAAISGRPALAAGDAVGASVTALTLVLGLAAVLGCAAVDATARRVAPIAAASAGLAVLTLADARLSRTEAAVLVVAYAPFLIWVLRRDHIAVPVAARGTEADRGATTGQAVLGMLGIVAMTLGGWLAVNGAERLVEALGRPDGAVGLTLLGLATSAELLALIWATSRRGTSDLIVSAVVGSVAFNATLTLGLTGLVHPGAVTDIAGSAVAVAVLATGLAMLLAARRELSRRSGAALLAGYGLFVLWTLGTTSPTLGW